MSKKIDISHRTIVFITLFALGLWITYLILDLLILLFVALILTSALAPIIKFLEKFKLPKPLGILIAYIIIFIIVGVILASLFTPLKDQSEKLISTLPPLLAERFNIANFDQTIFQGLTGLTSNIFSYSLAIFNNILTIILLLVLTFYLLLEKEEVEARAASLFVGQEDRIKRLIIKIEDKLGAWLIGQLALSVIIGIITYLGLYILNIPYALPFALLAGVLEVVPVIGPIIAAIPVVALAFTITPILGLGVTAMYFVIQQLENHIIVPQVMKRAVGINPLVVILAIALGSRLLGIGGALLAVPIVVVLQIIVMDIILSRQE